MTSQRLQSALVTGGAGFIGSHLVEALVQRDVKVRVLDDFSTGLHRNLEGLSPSVEVMTADVRDAAACQRGCAGVDVVFHLAALGSVPRSLEDPGATMAVNVAGTAAVFAAAHRSGSRVVYASSSSVYGDSEILPKREGQEGVALSPYALSKAFAEALAGWFGTALAVPSIGLRFFNVYGPRQRPDGPYAAVVPRFVAAAMEQKPMTIHGDGLQTRDFTFVSDAVDAALMSAVAPSAAWGRSYNVAGGESVTIAELARRLAELAGSHAPPLHLPSRSADVRHSLADLAAIRDVIGFRSRVSLAEGLRRTLAAPRSGPPERSFER